jgi:hypothetical protein
MFNAAVHFDDVARAIQLALAPVFLLTGIAGLLNVMAGRLARIIDRGRYLTETPARELPLTQWHGLESSTVCSALIERPQCARTASPSLMKRGNYRGKPPLAVCRPIN